MTEKLLHRVPPLTSTQMGEVVEEILSFGLRPGRLYAVPLFVLGQKTFDAIGIVVAKQADGGKARLGVFQNLPFPEPPEPPTAYPGALVADFGEVDISAIGESALDIELAFGESPSSFGLYWLAIAVDAAASVRGNVLHAGSSYGYMAESPYAPLPEEFPESATELDGEAPGFLLHEKEAT